MPVRDIEGVRVMVLDEAGPALLPGRALSDHLGDMLSEGAEWSLIPLARLPEGFFTLANGLAGEVLQKLVTYRRRVAIVGDVSEYTARSEPLAALVRESNRGDQVWFVPDTAAFEAKLTSRRD